MRIIPLLLFISLLVGSCRKVVCDDCISLKQTESWQTEQFKTNYTIEFPADYTGIGMTGFEGNIFYKKRSDNSVVLEYNYCGPLHCSDFGDELALPEPSQVEILVANKTVYLDKKIRLCADGGAAIALFYYNEAANANGLLYWLDEGKYKKALNISYAYSRHDEVVKIVRGIKK